MRKIIFFLFMLMIVSCVSTKTQMKAAFDPWIGSTGNSLIMKWGPPTKVYELPTGGYKIYTWAYQHGNTPVTASQYEKYDYAASSSVCEFNWTVNNLNIVESYNYKGSCRVGK